MIDPFFARLDSPEHGNIRMITDKKGDTWFAAFDLIQLFGFTDVLKTLEEIIDPSDATYLTYADLQNYDDVDFSRYNPDGHIFVNESGFWSLALGSDLPEARKFQRHIFLDVVPEKLSKGEYIPVPEDFKDPLFVTCFTAMVQKEADKENKKESEKND